VPDWVYEEEVFSSNYAMWWSPDSSRVAYLRFDETKVSEFTFPIYNPTNDANSVIPYPNHVTMKYPKPGYDNPLVTVHIFDFDSYEDSAQDSWAPSVSSHVWTLSWEKQRPTTDSIIQEVAWVNDAALIIKEVARAGDDGNVIYFDLTDPRKPGKVVRRLGKDGEEGDKGWIDSVSLIRFMLVINLTIFSPSISSLWTMKIVPGILPHIWISCLIRRATTILHCSVLPTPASPSGLQPVHGRSQVTS
jgi:dipeptidyl aminopeptidase